jgi:hypothetical protein
MDSEGRRLHAHDLAASMATSDFGAMTGDRHATYIVAFAAVFVTITACQRTEGARPISKAAPSGVLGTAPVTNALVIDVGASDVRLVMDQPQPIMVSNLGTRDLRDSITYSFESKPPGCAEPDVTQGRIAVRNRARDCTVRWDISIPRIPDVRVRASVGRIELVAPSDRAISLDANVGTVKLQLDGRELDHARSPGAGDRLRLGNLNTLPRLDVRTGVGSIHAELHTRTPKS